MSDPKSKPVLPTSGGEGGAKPKTPAPAQPDKEGGMPGQGGEDGGGAARRDEPGEGGMIGEG